MGIDAPCPTCGRELKDPRAVQVCGPCAGTLAKGALQSTGEFAAMSPDQAAELLGSADPPAQPFPTSAGDAACSWCGRGRADVKKLLSSAGAHICDGCVALCADILTAELGADWR
jgi:hypothetical protein